MAFPWAFILPWGRSARSFRRRVRARQSFCFTVTLGYSQVKKCSWVPHIITKQNPLCQCHTFSPWDHRIWLFLCRKPGSACLMLSAKNHVLGSATSSWKRRKWLEDERKKVPSSCHPGSLVRFPSSGHPPYNLQWQYGQTLSQQVIPPCLSWA